MYSSVVTGLDDGHTDASFELQHALAVMKVKVKKGSYTGAGVVTSCAVWGDPIGLTGKLDGTTGNLSGVTAGKVSADKSYTISETTTDHDIIFVPTTTAGQVTVGLTMDGKEYTTTTTSSETFTSNQCYTLNLTVDDSGATLSGIEVGDWTISGEGNEIITAGGYKIKFEGDYAGIAFSVSESGGDVTILASGTAANTCPQQVTGSVTISQSTNAQTRFITIPGINSDVSITFTGVKQIPMTYTWNQAKQVDGVWGIKSQCPVLYSDAIDGASIDGVALIVKGIVYQVSNTGLSSVRWHYGSPSNISELPDYDTVNGNLKSSWLNDSKSTEINLDYKTWLSGSLSDFNGKTNTEIIITSLGADAENTIAKTTVDFRSGSSNQGYNDWFIPSCGQLACMYLERTRLNVLLSKCSGSTLPLTTHWSSSEYDGSQVWIIAFSNGGIAGYYSGAKGSSWDLRFLREIPISQSE